MATIEIAHDPEFDSDKLYAFLKPRLDGKYSLAQTTRRQTARQQRIHGMQWVVVVKKHAWFGAFLLVKQRPNRTQIKIWTDPPSENVFRVFIIIPILIPLLVIVAPVIKIGSRPIVNDVRACLDELRAAKR